MSRRNTYLLGGLAVAAGIAMLVIAITGLTSNGDDSPPTNEQAAPERPIPEGATTPGGTEPGGAGGDSGSAGRNATGDDIRQELARRRLVRAPDFSAEVIHDGSIPRQLQPAFERGARGGELGLSELRGTPVVLYLWSARCAPCRPNTRLIESTWRRWGQRGVLFVGVSVNESGGTVEDVIRQYDLTFPGVADPSGEIAEQYGATALPQAFFVSARGDIVGEVAGAPSVRQLEVGTAAAKSGEPFGSEQGSSRIPLR